jgi:hypothetical protein
MSFFAQSGLRHTFWRGPWHWCDRCDKKVKVADCKWEYGLLLGPECQDSNATRGPGLIGPRDVRIAQVLTDGKEELVPVEKVRHPDFAADVENFLV